MSHSIFLCWISESHILTVQAELTNYCTWLGWTDWQFYLSGLNQLAILPVMVEQASCSTCLGLAELASNFTCPVWACYLFVISGLDWLATLHTLPVQAGQASHSTCSGWNRELLYSRGYKKRAIAEKMFGTLAIFSDRLQGYFSTFSFFLLSEDS